MAALRKTGAQTIKKYCTMKLMTLYGFPTGGGEERRRKAYPMISQKVVKTRRMEKA